MARLIRAAAGTVGRSGLLTLGLVLAACEPGPGAGASPSPGSNPSFEPEAWAMPALATTAATLALSNLDAGIGSAERKFALRPTPREASPLVAGRLARFRILNRLEDLDRAAEVVGRLGAGAAEAEELRAQVAAARHHFTEAANHLDRAVELGADPEAQVEAKAAVAVALGDGERALELLAGRPDRFGVSFLRGAALAELGAFVDADAAFVRALETYTDVSPFPVAETYFRRGLMWSEMAGRSDLGLRMYREGLRVLDGHVTMSIHEAELTAEDGGIDAAIGRLEALLNRTDEPELAGFLGELYLARGDTVAGAEQIERARRGYELRLARHRAAYLDHGSEFFRGPGEDPDRALRLALENLGLRPNQRAYLLALEAALAAEDRRTACELVRALEDRAVTVQALLERLEATRPGC